MKRVFIFSMCIFLITTSIIVNIPMGIYAADNDFTLSIDYNTINNKNCSLSYDEANNAVNNHGDIYSSDHELAFRYSPNGNYNWISSGGSIYFSDNQLFNFLRSDCNFKTYSVIAGGVVSNNGVIRSLLKGCGFLVGKDSSLITGAIDSLTGNYNYLNDMTYSETDGLTIGKDTVEKLKEKARLQYMKTIHAIPYACVTSSPAYPIEANRAKYDEEADYVSDWTTANTYDYAFSASVDETRNLGYEISCFNKSDYSYIYISNEDMIHDGINHVKDTSWANCFGSIHFTDDSGNLKDNILKHIGQYDTLSRTYCFYNSYGVSNFWNYDYSIKFSFVSPSTASDRDFDWDSNNSVLYSKDGSKPYIFNSYEAMYNYIHGSQDAYISSKIYEETKDVHLSIDDMNNDISDKLDEVIDSINNKKEGMSSQELQDAIDKGLADIGKNTEDIKDNTTDIKEDTGNILEVLKQQNDILLQILGVTEYIAYNKGEDKNNYTIADVSNCFNTMFSSLQYAVLYGVNKTGQNEASTASYAAYSVDTYDTYSTEVLDYRNGLFGKFPFSVPYQLYEWLQVLQTDPVAPMFNYNYGFLIGHTNEQAYDITFDLKQFESWASVGKSFLRLFFTLLFAIGIYKRFKGEV